jgi:hypothetical protein
LKSTYWIFSAVFWSLTLFGCGGKSGDAQSPPTTNALTNATFLTQVPGGAVTMQSLNSIMIGGFGITADSKIATAPTLTDKLMLLLGIQPAMAAPAINNMIYALDANEQLKTLNLIETIVSETGTRSTVSLDLLAAGTNSMAPRLTGMLNTPKYILLAYKNLYRPNLNGVVDRNNASTLCPILVLAKAAGGIHCLNLPPWCEDFSNCGNAHGNSSIQANGTGDIIYMQDENWHLYKVNLTDPSNIVILKLTDRTLDGAVQSLIVNSAGDAYVDIYTGVDFHDLQRIYKATATLNTDFQTLPDQFLNCTLTGPLPLLDDDNFYFRTSSNVLKKLVKQPDGSFVSSIIYSHTGGTPNPLDASRGVNCIKTITVGNYAFQMPTNNIADVYSTPNFVTEVLNPGLVQQSIGASPRTISFSDISKVMDIAACQSGFFVLGKDSADKDVIVKYAIANPSETTVSNGTPSIVLSASSNYSVTQLTVRSTCEVEFLGSNTVTGAKVIAALSNTASTPTVKRTYAASISKIISLK